MATDPRFARLHTDPRFVRPKNKDSKLVVDERFKSLFEAEEGGGKKGKGKGKGRLKVDKYGRPVTQDQDAKDLKRFYRLEDEDEDEDEDEEAKEAGKKKFVDYARGEVLMESSDEEEDEGGEESGGEEIEVEIDEDEDEDEDDSSEPESDIELGPSTSKRRARRASSELSIDLDEDDAGPLLDQEATTSQAAATKRDQQPEAKPSKRIAIVNLDWDNLQAIDIYKVFSSVLSSTAPPPDFSSRNNEPGDIAQGKGKGKWQSSLNVARGRCLNVRIYPSSFGKERMKVEEKEGPPLEIFGRKKRRTRMRRPEKKVRDQEAGREGGDLPKLTVGDVEEEDEEDEEEVDEDTILRDQQEGGEEFDESALRKYQLERLRYYYAIAEFDTVDAARHAFNEIEGTEFERTANMFDLSYVPDDMEFDASETKDEANQDMANYQGVDFVTDALRHSKVKLTWDADDPHRRKKLLNIANSISGPAKTGKGNPPAKGEYDDFNLDEYLAGTTSEEDEDEVDQGSAVDDFFEPEEGKGKTSKRDKLRSLFGLDTLSSKDPYGNGKEGEMGEMEITFAPALSEAVQRRLEGGKGGVADEKKEETSLDSYKRKEKERRDKKKQKKLGGEVSAGIVEDGSKKKVQTNGVGGFDDEFFDEEPDMEAALKDYEAGTFDDEDEDDLVITQKKDKNRDKALSKAEKKAEREAADRERAELSLLMDDDTGVGGSKHFDMRAIIKAEKSTGKKRRRGKKGKKGAGEEDAVEGLDDGFQMDVKDERFRALYENPEFAIDPSNPAFVKTKNMTKLLEEGRVRRERQTKDEHERTRKSKEERQADGADRSSGSLSGLVQSIKRKSRGPIEAVEVGTREKKKRKVQ